VALSVIYKDKIIGVFINEANKQLKTPIKVGKIDLSLLENFPNLSIIMNDVFIQENLPNSKEPLAVADKIYFSFDLFNLILGKYVIDQVEINEAEVSLIVTKDGKLNYLITENRKERSSNNFKFDIDKIKIKNVAVVYYNMRKEELVDMYIDDADAKLSQTGNLLDIDMQGAVTSKVVRINGRKFFEEKPTQLNAKMIYNLETQFIMFKPSIVAVNGSKFLVDGNYQIDKVSHMNLNVKGEHTDIQTILSLFPEELVGQFKKYKSEGDIYFNGNIKGPLGRDLSPKLDISFGSNDASFIYPGYNKKIEKVSLEGNFTSESMFDLSKAVLSIKNFQATLDGHRLNGYFILKDFEDYFLDCSINGSLDVKSLLGFFPNKTIKNASGLLDIDIDFKGKIKGLDNQKAVKQVKNSGEITVKNLSFNLTNNKLPFKNINGNLLFYNSDLAINNFKAQVGKSDFKFDGYFKNYVSQVFSKSESLVIQANLKSSNIDMDELLSSNISETKHGSSGTSNYYFDLTPRLELQFDCDVKKLTFRRFTGQNISGGLTVKNQVAIAKNIKFKTAGGIIKLNGKIDARPKGDILVATRASFDGLNIDKVFYIFENFHQDFLIDKHLKGQIFANVTTKLGFNKNLDWYPNSLVSDVAVTIKNGELNNFEPMQKVAKFIRNESLDKLRFSEIKNNIHIENKTIYIPSMQVQSNVRTIEVKGTHTFDQKINYYLKVPIRNQDQRDKDETFGAIKKESGGQSHLFLIINGTTDDYKIIYDTDAVKKKIKKGIKDEGQELRDIIENKGEEKETIELNDDEYFDFDGSL